MGRFRVRKGGRSNYNLKNKRTNKQSNYVCPRNTKTVIEVFEGANE